MTKSSAPPADSKFQAGLPWTSERWATWAHGLAPSHILEPYTEAEVAAAEARLGMSLPPSYRTFLLTVGRMPPNYRVRRLPATLGQGSGVAFLWLYRPPPYLTNLVHLCFLPPTADPL